MAKNPSTGNCYRRERIATDSQIDLNAEAALLFAAAWNKTFCYGEFITSRITDQLTCFVEVIGEIICESAAGFHCPGQQKRLIKILCLACFR
jgi:hypothetical protein